jgi:DNA-binding CsgD family transcriptional regulator
MLSDELMAVSRLATRDELLKAVDRLSWRLGFDKMSAMAVFGRPRSCRDFHAVDNVSAEYRDHFQSYDGGKRDPVMQHCKVSSVPIIWNQDTYVASGCGAKWETQARFGYRTGIAVAIHLHHARHFLIGVDRDQALPSDKVEVSRITAELLLFAVLVHDAALRILLPQACVSNDIQLPTARELECMRWTMEGKTAWEVGTILGISERTAVRHLNNASRKLSCINKHQAVLKALQLGLIR